MNAKELDPGEPERAVEEAAKPPLPASVNKSEQFQRKLEFRTLSQMMTVDYRGEGGSSLLSKP